MSNCKICGRDDGHYIGCANASKPLARLAEAVVEHATACEAEDCNNPKFSAHQSVKYCEDHRDPRNRK